MKKCRLLKCQNFHWESVMDCEEHCNPIPDPKLGKDTEDDLQINSDTTIQTRQDLEQESDSKH